MSWTTYFALAGGVLAWFAVGIGCTPLKAYRQAPNPQAPQSNPKTGSWWVNPTDGSEMLVVEIDDQGEMWGNPEREFAINRVRFLAEKTDKPLTLIVFAHGWHHNALASDSHLIAFQQEISSFARRDPTRRWAGLYLGWRGESSSFPLITYLTYWNRRNAAARVGGIPVAHFLGNIAKVVADPKSQADVLSTTTPLNDNMLIVVGHSFGGRVIETAVTNALAFDTFKSPIDLVVLLNEASEALRAKAVIDAYKTNADPERGYDLPPRIVSITSVGDWATGITLPIGQWFVALREKFRDYQTSGTEDEKTLPGQKKLFEDTAAHTPKLSSHLVEDAKQPLGPEKAGGVTYFPLKKTPNDKDPEYVLVPVDKTAYNSRTPYWIIEVPKTISKDHDDIFNDRLSSMIEAIIDTWFPSPSSVKRQRLNEVKAREERKLRKFQIQRKSFQ